MVLGLLLLAGSSLLGIYVVKRALPEFDLTERILSGTIIGWLVITLVGYLVARVQGRLTFASAIAITVGVWLIVAVLFLPAIRKGLTRPRFDTFWKSTTPARTIALVFFGVVFARLYDTHMLAPGPAGVYSRGSTLYDLGFHLAIANAFQYGQNFPPLYTPFPPAPLLYPYLPDFQLALLGVLGMNSRTSLIVTGTVMAICLIGIFYSFARQIIYLFDSDFPRKKVDLICAASIFLFVLNGGVGFYYFFLDWRASGTSLVTFLSTLNLNYAHLSARQLEWANFISDALLPQRTSVFGFALAFIVLALLARAWKLLSVEASEHRETLRLLIVAGVLTAILPVVHTHSYIGIGLISGFLFLVKPRRKWIAFWIPAVVLALPHLVGIALHVSNAGSFVRLQPGWRFAFNWGWILFWVRNIGLPALLIVPAWFSAPALARRFYLAFVALLIFSLVLVVSPNDFDNIKLLYLWYASTTVLIAAWLIRIARSRTTSLVALVFFGFCIASGVLALQYENAGRELMYSNEEMGAANFVRQETQPHALFLTAPSTSSIPNTLGGRAVLRANTPWLWSHGYDFAAREADVKSIYRGGEDAMELIKYYGINYVFLGARERELAADQTFFDSHFKPVFRSETITIYEVNPNTTSLTSLPARELASRIDKDPHALFLDFSDTSYSICRLYQSAFGRWPRYTEFADDMKLIGRDLFIGAPGWQQKLAENKKELLAAFVDRNEFREKYQMMSDDAFVNALVSAPLSTADRAKLTSRLANGATRAEILGEVIESATSSKAGYNAAYVLAHYFAYLRRNPDDSPDRDLTGFNFWVANLKRTQAYRDVTRAFLESSEYEASGIKQR